jgi:cytoskeletal protein RodZ
MVYTTGPGNKITRLTKENYENGNKSDNQNNNQNTSNKYWIIGGVFALVVIATIVWWWRSRSKQSNQSNSDLPLPPNRSYTSDEFSSLSRYPSYSLS